MSNDNQLSRKESLEKLKDIIGSAKTCMFITSQDSGISARPMHTVEIDDQGCLWFFSNVNHDHYEYLLKNPAVKLTYSDISEDIYLDIDARVDLVRDQDRIDELWSPFLNTWFDGKEDPNIVLYQVIIDKAHAWENKDGQFISFLKMAKSAITGIQSELGKETDLHL